MAPRRIFKFREQYGRGCVTQKREFPRKKVRDIASRDRYRRAIWVISSDIDSQNRAILPFWALRDVGHFPYEMAWLHVPPNQGWGVQCFKQFGQNWKFGQGSRLSSGVGLPARCFLKSLKLLPLHFGDAWHSINKSSTYSDYFHFRWVASWQTWQKIFFFFFLAINVQREISWEIIAV